MLTLSQVTAMMFWLIHVDFVHKYNKRQCQTFKVYKSILYHCKVEPVCVQKHLRFICGIKTTCSLDSLSLTNYWQVLESELHHLITSSFFQPRWL